MQLTVSDVAKILDVPTNTVYQWISERDLPVQYVNEQYFINRAELLEWATLQHIKLGPEIFRDKQGNYYSPVRFAKSLESGGIFYDVPGSEKALVLKEIVDRLPIPDSEDRDSLLELFLARETAGSTGVGDGIAIPHPRNPIVLPGAAPTISVFFLRTPIPFGAADGKPVHTLFALVAPTVQTHLHLLGQLAVALRDAGFRDAVARHGKMDELLTQARQVEATFDKRANVTK